VPACFDTANQKSPIVSKTPAWIAVASEKGAWSWCSLPVRQRHACGQSHVGVRIPLPREGLLPTANPTSSMTAYATVSPYHRLCVSMSVCCALQSTAARMPRLSCIGWTRELLRRSVVCHRHGLGRVAFVLGFRGRSGAAVP
jgi:hypothetical protein